MEILRPVLFHALHVEKLGHTLHNLTKLHITRLAMPTEYNPEDPNQSFTVNYQSIINEKSLLSITRMLAVQMTKNPYITVGDFLRDLSNGDIESLVDIIEEGEEHENFSDLMLIAEMLATGEGLEAANLDLACERVNQFLVLITCESLARKGLVEVLHKNMSFGEDMKDAVVVKKLND